ncbi:hypothetical protein DPMN_163918 [Dreissena polymorpha]|uniref:Integrase catalytic domain-containing protein n=1 Tax=Dreissena polymorpha TaxID=45954 RepID=A0A9D4IUW3_DREPO|nr:hypothetical protein DPMN_163918 [Dreissena polymorpha]
MRSVDDFSYYTLVELLKGNYQRKVSERSAVEKSALVMFWRKMQRLSLRGENLLHDGKIVVRKSAVQKIVKQKFKETRGAGARADAYSLKSKYKSVSDTNVRRGLTKHHKHGEINAKFTNKPPIKPIHACQVFEKVQIDLVRLKEISVCCKMYKYILTNVDVFSRFVFLRPLKSKSTEHVARALKSVFREWVPAYSPK